MSDQVVVERQVVIAAPQRAVFGFLSDYHNDPKWRAEVERMEYPTPLEIGALLIEYSTFNGKQLRTPTVLLERDEPHRARVQTPPEFAYYLENIRTVEEIDADTSRFTYRLTFDREILRPVMSDLPPAEAISAWYGGTVEGYLATLKTLLEDAQPVIRLRL